MAKIIFAVFPLISLRFVAGQRYGDVKLLTGGVSQGYIDGIGSNVRFHRLFRICISPDESYALVADVGNHVIRKIIISTSLVSTLAGEGSNSGDTNGYGTNTRFNYPNGVSISSDGSFALITDSSNYQVRKIDLSTIQVSFVVGGASGTSNGVGSNVKFNQPKGISISPDQTYALITDDYNCLIRKLILSTNTVSTFAGSACGYSDGIGINAFFYAPSAVFISPDGSFALVADTMNNQIRKIIISTQQVTLLAGLSGSITGSSNGIGTNALFNHPLDVSISSDGTFALITDSNNNQIRKLIISLAKVSLVAGSSTTSTGSTNGVGSNAQFNQPSGIAISPDQTSALITDYKNYQIREISLLSLTYSPTVSSYPTTFGPTSPTVYPTLTPSLSPTLNPTLECPIGWEYDPSQSECVECSVGYYSSHPNSVCRKCPKGRSNLNRQSSDCQTFIFGQSLTLPTALTLFYIFLPMLFLFSALSMRHQLTIFSPNFHFLPPTLIFTLVLNVCDQTTNIFYATMSNFKYSSLMFLSVAFCFFSYLPFFILSFKKQLLTN